MAYSVGRIGDTPSFGSGFYCSTWSNAQSKKSSLWNRITAARSKKSHHSEAGVAISGTGDGDYFLRNCAAYDVVTRMKYRGESVQRASKEVVEVLKEQEGIGGMIAVDLKGNCEL